jgi:hypothetical protein
LLETSLFQDDSFGLIFIAFGRAIGSVAKTEKSFVATTPQRHETRKFPKQHIYHVLKERDILKKQPLIFSCVLCHCVVTCAISELVQRRLDNVVNMEYHHAFV